VIAENSVAKRQQKDDNGKSATENGQQKLGEKTVAGTCEMCLPTFAH